MPRHRNNRPDTTALHLSGLATDLSRRELEHLAVNADLVDVPAGEVLARAGRTPHQFIAVVDGHVDITDPSGRTRVAGPGTRVGAAELIEQRPHAATITTRTRSTLLVIFGPAFRSFVGSRHDPAPAR
jgi:CRP-like cAMP-binding protein